MDDNHSMLATETLTLLRNESRPRPYQAYCVDEPSRPPTPDALTPKPLRIKVPLEKRRKNEAQHPPNNAIARALAIKFEPSGITSIQQQKNTEHGKKIPPNERPRSGNTMLANNDHITQAVNPRGSHPLTTRESTVYDRAQSQLRMQQTSPTYVATPKTYRRKPLPHHANIAIMERRPLPPLPLEPIPNLKVHNLGPERSLCQSPTQFRSEDDQNKGSCASANLSNEGWPLSCPSRALDKYQFDSPRPDNAPEAASSHTDRRPLPVERNTRERCPAAQQDEAIAVSTQLPSAEELYTPPGLLTDIDARRAHRRTLPKDTKFRYQFGRRPSVRLDNPPPTPLHGSAPTLTNDHRTNNAGDYSTREEYFGQLPPSSSLPAKVEPQAGPRPPPWGSTDNLEMRRQTRSDARERENARRYRLTADSGSSMYKGSDSTDSLRENTMRREVEEYREQVLRIYPDMEFDGGAGEGGRKRCCCLVM